MNVVLLLTGTINVNNMIFTVLQDSEVRKKEYIECLRFWINSTKLRIVFVENSGVDISQFFVKELKNGRLEILTFEGNNYDRSLGKGIGEFNCMNFAFQSSKFLSSANYIFKCTGRYKVLNFSSFLDDYNTDMSNYIMMDFKWNLSFCDSRFFGFKPTFFEYYLSKFNHLLNDSEGIYFEHILAKASLLCICDSNRYRPFVTLPRIEGYSGSSGVRYNSRYLHWLRYSIEYILKNRAFNLGNV